MNHKEKSIQFWNEQFKNYKPVSIKKEEVTIESSFDKYLKIIGDQSKRVIDIGCGIGTCLMGSLCLGDKMTHGVGFDSSEHAISFANETSKLSGFNELEYITSDETYLDQLESNSFDGVICSNFLDVIPKELSDQIIKNIKRILKPKGLLLLKINFYLDEDKIEKFHMGKVEENTYEMNGVIRAYNLTTDEWLKRLDGFKLVSKDGYQRAPNLPEDRILLLSLN